MKTGRNVSKSWLKVLFLLVISLCLLGRPVTAFATEGSENEIKVTELSGQAEVISDVNVRKGPGTNYDIIGTIRTGEVLPVTGKTEDSWYRVTYQSETGYVYGKYLSVTEQEVVPAAEEQTPNENQPAEQEEETSVSKVVKPIAILIMMIVIAVMMILTIRSMRQTDETEPKDYDGEDDYEEDDAYEDASDYEEGDTEEDNEDYEDVDDTDEDTYDDDADYEDDDIDEDSIDDADHDDSRDKIGVRNSKKRSQGTERKAKTAAAKKPNAQKDDFVLREEDYQLHIDPKYFEDDPVPQPDCVTGYLLKKEEEETAKLLEEQKKQGNAADIDRAMNKLQELQEELERLKKNQ